MYVLSIHRGTKRAIGLQHNSPFAEPLFVVHPGYLIIVDAYARRTKNSRCFPKGSTENRDRPKPQVPQLSRRCTLLLQPPDSCSFSLDKKAPNLDKAFILPISCTKPHWNCCFHSFQSSPAQVRPALYISKSFRNANGSCSSSPLRTRCQAKKQYKQVEVKIGVMLRQKSDRMFLENRPSSTDSEVQSPSCGKKKQIDEAHNPFSPPSMAQK